jgi:hypothetical protein
MPVFFVAITRIFPADNDATDPQILSVHLWHACFSIVINNIPTKKLNLPRLRIVDMTTGSNDQFYSRLPANEIPLSELLMEEHLFYKVPVNWHVVITDVESSTSAIDKGRHENVNLVATGSMVAVFNIAYKAGITIPAFFGGDGATFIIPSPLLVPVMQALDIHRDNTLKNFGLNLRVGNIPVDDIYNEGHTLTVSKLRTSTLFIIPVVLGDGLAYAEKIIKSPGYTASFEKGKEEQLDLAGMQCRWDTVDPPQTNDEVVSLLVVACDNKRQAPVFKQVIDKLDEIYGEQEKRKPISIPMLRLKHTIRQLVLEMRTKFGKYKPFYLAKAWLTSLVAPYYFKTKSGKNYLKELVAMSDNLVIDGKINTVISGTMQQRQRLSMALDELEKQKNIVYGLHVSKESVLSCYVRSLHEGHIHFVDGAGGGYTNAAGVLKKKLRE